MRSAEIILGRFEDRRHLTPVATLVTPQSVSQTPVVYLPHPSRHPDGWYHGPDQAVRGYAAHRSADKTAGAALLWTLLLGPLGLCYLSTGAGLAATGLTAAIVILSGSAVALAVIWPVAMLLSLLYASGR
jgi:hypothetical protein